MHKSVDANIADWHSWCCLNCRILLETGTTSRLCVRVVQLPTRNTKNQLPSAGQGTRTKDLQPEDFHWQVVYWLHSASNLRLVFTCALTCVPILLFLFFRRLGEKLFLVTGSRQVSFLWNFVIVKNVRSFL